MRIQQRIYQLTLHFLIALLLYNSAGYYLVFRLVQVAMQHKMELRIERAHELEYMQPITFKVDELKNIHWLKKGKEFSFKKKRYDIVRIEKNKDSHTYWCIADEDEDRLFANLHQYHDEHDRSMAKNKSKIKNITLLYPTYFFHKPGQPFYLHMISVVSAIPNFNHYPIVYREVHHPPPNLISII